ncbi:hypothetical protein ACTFIU_008475 [Dictyostelium citrinum]
MDSGGILQAKTILKRKKITNEMHKKICNKEEGTKLICENFYAHFYMSKDGVDLYTVKKDTFESLLYHDIDESKLYINSFSKTITDTPKLLLQTIFLKSIDKFNPKFHLKENYVFFSHEIESDISLHAGHLFQQFKVSPHFFKKKYETQVQKFQFETFSPKVVSQDLFDKDDSVYLGKTPITMRMIDQINENRDPESVSLDLVKLLYLHYINRDIKEKISKLSLKIVFLQSLKYLRFKEFSCHLYKRVIVVFIVGQEIYLSLIHDEGQGDAGNLHYLYHASSVVTPKSIQSIIRQLDSLNLKGGISHKKTFKVEQLSFKEVVAIRTIIQIVETFSEKGEFFDPNFLKTTPNFWPSVSYRRVYEDLKSKLISAGSQEI